MVCKNLIGCQWTNTIKLAVISDKEAKTTNLAKKRRSQHLGEGILIGPKDSPFYPNSHFTLILTFEETFCLRTFEKQTFS